MDKLSPDKIFTKTFKYVFFKMLMPIASLVVSLISLKIISAIYKGEVGIIGTLIWLVITIGFGFGINFFWGYKFRASHVAVVTDAVSVGVLPEDMNAMAKEAVEYRFPTCNDYLAYKVAVKSAIMQLQKDLNTFAFAERKKSVPVLGQLISFAQIIVGFALSFTYDLILGYTFWRDGKPLYNSAADGLAIYYNCWKRIAQNVLFLALEIVVGMTVGFVFVGAIGAAVLAPTYGPLAGGLAGAAVGFFLCKTAKIFIDSNLMIRTMFPFFEEAQYADITEEEYGSIYRSSPKYAKIYQKSQSELQRSSQESNQIY